MIFRRKNIKELTILSTRGNSLVQVIIAAGMMVIIGLAVSSMVSNQTKDVKDLTEKILINELESQIKTMLSNNNYCTCLLRGKTFNTTLGSEGIVVADQLANLPSGYSSGPLDLPPCSVNSDYIIPPVGSELPGVKATVATVGLTNMQILSPGNYKADIKVTFANTVRVLKGIKTGLQFAIDPSLNAITNRPFLFCSTVSAGTGGVAEPPVGSIIAWHKSFLNTPVLPTGWIECNGQVINDTASVYDTQTAPNLNSNTQDGSTASGMFLRGSSSSGVLQADATAVNGLTATSTFPAVMGSTPGGGGPGVAATSGGALTITVNSTDVETRPPNMTVVWIMRIR